MNSNYNRLVEKMDDIICRFYLIDNELEELRERFSELEDEVNSYNEDDVEF